MAKFSDRCYSTIGGPTIHVRQPFGLALILAALAEPHLKVVISCVIEETSAMPAMGLRALRIRAIGGSDGPSTPVRYDTEHLKAGFMDDFILHTFQAAKWLPETASFEDRLPLSQPNWFPFLAEHSEHGGHHYRLTRWFQEQIAAGAQLTATIRTSDRGSIDANQWGLSGRLYWWPAGVPTLPLTAIVSSRLSRRLHEHTKWFEAFRAICREISSSPRVILIGENTAAARFVKRASVHYGLTPLVIHEPGTSNVNSWLRNISRTPGRSSRDNEYELFVSPIIGQGPFDDQLSNIPLRDRLVMAMADELIAIYVRPRGNLERLIRNRLAGSSKSAGVSLVTGESRVPPALALDLQALGAKEWLHRTDSSAEDAHSNPESAACARNAPKSCFHRRICRGGSRFQPFRAPVMAWNSFLQRIASQEWRFLSHCTRAPDGPWPDQTKEEFIDELLFGLATAARTPLAALMRIVSQRRICASSSGLRGGTPVVCFTEVPLSELHHLRTFQPQRHRWDFEPYGICIRRERLIELGARAVQYGDEVTWDSLPEADRPFFQLQATRRAKRQRSWAREREWRHPADVDLNQISSWEALLFVPDAAAAESLRTISRWPIVIGATDPGSDFTDGYPSPDA